MSLQLQPDQLLAVLFRLEHPVAKVYERQLLTLCDDMAQEIVEAIPNLTKAEVDFWGEMVCAPIKPIDSSLPIPEALQGFDDGGWE